jgi:hypothetical protein
MKTFDPTQPAILQHHGSGKIETWTADEAARLPQDGDRKAGRNS